MKQISKQQNRQKGIEGERRACHYLFWHGYKVIQRNYTCPLGEIDIIAKKKKLLVIIEVKSRQSLKYGTPSEAVTPYKQNRIIQAAKFYIVESKIVNTQIRFDCIEILKGKINHIINAFEA